MHLVKSSALGVDHGCNVMSIAEWKANAANADHTEPARIVPEKPDALSACAFALIGRSGRVAEQVAGFAADEVVLAARACVALADCRTPGALALAQQGLFLAWAARVVSRTAALGALAMLSHGAAVTPFDNAATANAERLSRYPGANRPTLGH